MPNASLAKSGHALWATTARWPASTLASKASTTSGSKSMARRIALGAVGAAPLRVSGLTRMTSIDFPGQLAAVVFCQGCPWRCGYCHNPDLLDATAPAAMAWGEVLAVLHQRQGLLDAVVFSGGEPLLQPGLPAALQEVRALG